MDLLGGNDSYNTFTQMAALSAIHLWWTNNQISARFLLKPSMLRCNLEIEFSEIMATLLNTKWQRIFVILPCCEGISV